jgi:hypothetical protein
MIPFSTEVPTMDNSDTKLQVYATTDDGTTTPLPQRQIRMGVGSEKWMDIGFRKPGLLAAGISVGCWMSTVPQPGRDHDSLALLICPHAANLISIEIAEAKGYVPAPKHDRGDLP